jgi:hypothetical protein
MYLHYPDLQFVAIIETWLHDEIPSSLTVDTYGYSVFRKDQRSRGGGVGLLFKNNTNMSVSQVVLPSEFSCLESILYLLMCVTLMMPYQIIVAKEVWVTFIIDQHTLLGT